MIYLLVFILLLIPVIKYDWMAKSGGENKWYYLNLVVLILLAGLRYRLGGDTLMYMSMYNEWPAMDELEYFDFEEALYNPLWYVYASVAKSLSGEFWVLQIIQSVIVNSVFFWFFKKYSPQYYFSVILLYYIGFYCYFNMEIMREALCICVLLLITGFLLEKRWLFYYLGCIVAISIHFSAVIMLFFPLGKLLFKKPSFIMQIIILLSILALTTVVNIPVLILQLLSVNETITILAEKYLDDQRSIMGMLFQMLQYLPLLGMMFIRSRFKDIYSNVYVDFTFIVSLAVAPYALSMPYEGFSRLINYFVPFILIFTVHTAYYFVTKLNLRDFQVSSVVVLLSLMLVFYNYSYYYLKDTSKVYPNTRFGIRYYPYSSILNPEINNARENYIENDRDVIIAF